jgi:aryl-alcohol dehydrogenase
LSSKAIAVFETLFIIFDQPSFATHTLATVRNVVKVPRTLPLRLLAPLGCGLQTGAAR